MGRSAFVGCGALGVALALASACRSEISLGTPDAGATAADAGVLVVPPRCPGSTSRSVVAEAADSFGELRGLAASNDSLYALFAAPRTREGVLARVALAGGTLVELARVGSDPAGLAVAADSAHVFVAARGSAQIFRVERSGTATVVNASGAPSSIVAGDPAGAFWTVPANDGVLQWELASATARSVATSPHATSLALRGGVLTIVGNRAVRTLTPGVDAAPRVLAAHCDDGAPALHGQSLYCVESDSIVRVDLTTGDAAVVATAQTGATNVVVAAGRVLWRAAPSPRQTLVMALALDGIGDATVFESSGPGPLIMAEAGCDLYFSAGRSIVRRGL